MWSNHRQTWLRPTRYARARKVSSNFLMPAVMLWEQGIHPLNCFVHVEFTGGHDKAALAVYQGLLEVGAGHDGVISDLAKKPGFEDATRKLVRLAWSEPIPSDPVCG